MSKRFTESDKWEDPWFRRLSPKLKCLWQFLCDKCDAAGVIDFDSDSASFHIGDSITNDDLAHFGHRVQFIPSGKLFVVGFVKFQYGTLSEECLAHRPVFKSIERNSLDIPYGKACTYPSDTLPHRVGPTLKDKDKDKDKDEGVQREIEAIYAEYPRKVCKPRALKAIAAALKRVPFADLLAKVKAYAPSVAGKEMRFIPHPATWFNDERYNDPIETQSRAAVSASEMVEGLPENIRNQPEPESFLGNLFKQ